MLVGSALVYCAGAKTDGSVEAPQVIGALAGLLLIAGLWTPLARVSAGCAEAAVLGVTLALIGPGEWSIDAWLYGRKHYVPTEL